MALDTENQPATVSGIRTLALAISTALLIGGCSEVVQQEALELLETTTRPTQRTSIITAPPTTTTSVTEEPEEPPDEPTARGYHHMTAVPGLGLMMCCGWDTSPPDGGRPLPDFWTIDVRVGEWRYLSSPERSRIVDAAMSYDSRADRVILHVIVETWAYDPSSDTWENLGTETLPGRISGARMVYDVQSDKTIVFGGQPPGGGGMSDETWAFDFESRTWILMEPALTPSARSWPAMAYDEQSDRVIVFSGTGRADTWAYDYDTNTWTEMTPAESPPARVYSQMAYAPGIDRVILFGGTGAGEEPFGDTWAYDYETNTWTELAPANAPSPRGWHAMAVNPADGTIVLFGGGAVREDYQDDIWIYDSVANTWTQTN
jgi:hypothetical protein